MSASAALLTAAPKTAKTVKGQTPSSNEPTWLESIFFGKETP